MKKNYLHHLEKLLLGFRSLGMKINEVNPITALSCSILEDLYLNNDKKNNIESTLNKLNHYYSNFQKYNLRKQVGIKNKNEKIINCKDIDIEKEIYRAVFTAHPVFALTKTSSEIISKSAENNSKIYKKNIYATREKITLKEEHDEALNVIFNARKAISSLNRKILESREKDLIPKWKEKLPLMLGVSTWVGYDLDGRSDISWLDTFYLRLLEKKIALAYYINLLDTLKLKEVEDILKKLKNELSFTKKEVQGFRDIKNKTKYFSKAINLFTERKNKLISSHSLSNKLHKIAKKLPKNKDCISLMIIAADIKNHGFGIAEVHLMVNASQIHNAMSFELKWDIFNKNNLISSKSLLDKLSEKLLTEKKWEINFKNLDDETSIAKRQLMIATQIFKHIDNDQPIRFLIAECEQPISIFSALYLAKKLDVHKKIDISPLFETKYGLEHGQKVIKDLLLQKSFVEYVRSRKRLSIQTGYSDAGRFIGQIAANIEIEQLQLKISKILSETENLNIDLLLFNTHGEALGRGGTQSTMTERQLFMISPYVRYITSKMQLHIYHQTSFQGGDGYRLFGTKNLAKNTISNIFFAEIKKYNKKVLNDHFYIKENFSKDFFLFLKNWHNKLFANPDYHDLVNMFSTNLLMVTGSRPSKRPAKEKNINQNLSEIRAITHNAILQQLGFLTNVISGFGKTANVDLKQFLDTYKSSNRLKQLLMFVLKAKSIGSLNTLLAYCNILDPGFWIDQAYHEKQILNKFAYRKIGDHLRSDKRASKIKNLIWRLRDDLMDLYIVTEKAEKINTRTSGKERVNLDILHSLRIALIINSLVIMCKIPKLSTSNKFTNSDILSYGLLLDFNSVVKIIRSAFTNDESFKDGNHIQEKENYSSNNKSSLSLIEREIIKPLERNNKMIKNITQLVAVNHGAYG